ncbi:MAG: peptidase M24, partial [Candidatus Aminicenantales bacterium]
MARWFKRAVFLVLVVMAVPHVFSRDARGRWEKANMIRSDKFDFVLPKAMRVNRIDMWIIVDRGRGTEPLFQDFGEATSNGNGIFIFTDRGGDRIERAVLGGEPELLEESGIYDIFEDPRNLRKFVAERDPKRIGVNISTAEELFLPEGRHLSDGLS